ncbi:MAG: hypothetical protein EOO10_25245 [Chitinophagaceae bacterium]|nr:MAG: hypothetical protein EOO10_25245 [Chitinophagaceae bacterium]
MKENGTLKITSPLQELKRRWIELLKTNGILSPLSEITVMSAREPGKKKEYYYLLGTTEDKATKVAVLLRAKNGYFYLPKNNTKPASINVICTGCIEGCNPQQSDKYWYCATECDSTCTKISTIDF